MEIIGRITGDAKVTTLGDGREVVHFSVAINDRYKVKGSDEVKEITTYVNCSYWLNKSLAPHLTKGRLVGLYGRLGVNAWKDMQGEPRATITFHVNDVKFHTGKGSQSGTATQGATANTPAAAEQTEDLPF